MVISNINAIPKMTSNTAPSGVVSASTIYNASFEAWRAFDGVANDQYGWATSSVPSGYIAYKFAKPIVIGSYKIFGASSMTTSDWAVRNPKTWTFEGSNDGSAWTVLDTKNILTWTNNEEKTFIINNNIPYLDYRLNITSNIGGSGILQFSELMMFEVLKEKRLVIKNPITSQHYSFAEKTLISLPSTSNQNMILHGIGAGKEIQLDVDYDKVKLIKEASEALGEGKTFTHAIDINRYKVKSIKL